MVETDSTKADWLHNPPTQSSEQRASLGLCQLFLFFWNNKPRSQVFSGISMGSDPHSFFFWGFCWLCCQWHMLNNSKGHVECL